MEIYLQHQKDIRNACNELKNKQSSFPMVLEGQNPSYTLRENAYRKLYPHFSISKFSRVISVNAQKRIAYVEPGVTVEELVNATLVYGLIPPIVPEFKGITIGGAIMGGSFESGSFHYGQFNDICVSYEILLGNGSRIKASPDEYQDLFYGVVGSYGSIGVLLGVEIALVPAGHNVIIYYHRFDRLSAAIDFFIKKSQKKEDTQFLEGILYEHNEITVIEGKMTSLEYSYPKKNYHEHWSRWFFQHARQTVNKQEILPLKDYLFRHDRAALWMGCYLMHPALVFRFLLAKFGLDWFSEIDAFRFQKVCNPGFTKRFCIGRLLSSKFLFSFLHSGWGSEDWVSQRFIIQNFYLPVQNAAEFIEYVIKETGITPVRLCPVKSTTSPQLFSPHYQPYLNRSLLIAIGIYGYQKNAPIVTQKLENQAMSLGGKKMLYGYSYYSEDGFWNIYAQEEYQALRKKYFAEKAWVSIEEKVLGRTSHRLYV